MAERVVRVRLTAAVSAYEKSMKDAANATATVGTEAEKLAQKKEAFQQLGTAGVTMGAVIAGAIGLAAKRFADFDAAMSSVQAATHESAANMDLLRQAALDAGESTVFSATESAAAIEELAKAGVSTADILNGGLTGALDLAAAGELGVADAAGIASTALKMFNLSGSDMGHVADLLASGAGKAMGDVSDLAQALNQAGLVANQTGLSIEETTAGLSAFAEQGLLGSDAGTSFKSMLQALTPASAQAAELMKKYNIEAYDAQGNFVGLAEYAGKLKTGLSGLSTEQQNATLKTIFGSDAVRAATVLYQNGSEGIEEWTKAVDDQGYAASTAAIRLDNLKGDVEALGGAFETALIDTGSAANDTLRTMVQALSGLIGIYNDLPAPVQASVMALGGATAAVALTGGAAFLAVPKWLEFKATVEASTWTMKGIGLTAGAAGLALGGLFVVVGELAAQHQRGQARAKAYADAIEEGTNKLSDAARATAIEELQKGGELLSFNWQSAFEAAEKLGVGADLVTDAALKNSDAIDKLSDYYGALSGDQEAFNRIQEETGMNAYETRAALEAMIGGIEKQNTAIDDAIQLKNQETTANSSVTGTIENASKAYIAQADAVADLNSQLTDLIARVNEANGIAQDAVTANARYQSALDGLTAQVEKNGTSLDENTASGSANAAALSDVAAAAQNAAQAQLDQDAATMGADDAAQKYLGTLAAQRQAFIDSAIGAGYNADEVRALADRIFAMPTEKEFNAIVETAQAQQKLDYFVTQNNGRTIRIKVAADGSSIRMGSITVDQGIPGQAAGGAVRGPGTGTSDSVLRRLSNGEHVVTAAEVQGAGGHDQVEKYRAMMLAGNNPTPSYAQQPTWVRGPEVVYLNAPAASATPSTASFPETVTLVDADGSILTRARVIADGAVQGHSREFTSDLRSRRRKGI